MDSLLHSCNRGKLFWKTSVGCLDTEEDLPFATALWWFSPPLCNGWVQLHLCKAFLAKEGRIYLTQLRGHHRNCPSSGYLHCRRCQGCVCVYAHISQAWGDVSREVSKGIVVCSGDARAVPHLSRAEWPELQNLLVATRVQAPESIGTRLSPVSCKGVLITRGSCFSHGVTGMADFMALFCTSVTAAPGHHLWLPLSSL